ncbi:hypothetical protein Ga0100230_000715 [Opitutaceae bacterium TAV3]|nr:hypothetical protein Ga0100230_000715 [Opitutaceae bacterium TAV3]
MQDLTLEVSLKPFCNLDDAATLATCAEALRQWDHLARHASRVSLLLWASDGSEILDYTGDLDTEMEWARYVGNSNSHLDIPSDPEKKSLHSRSYLYRPDARPITYRRLAAIVRAWREAASAAPATQGKPFRVGLAFDPGGEFAPSDFKYKRHREICLSDTMGKASFVCCYGILNADTRRYAAYPDGIPQDTGIGTFLGRQFRHLATDTGLDYLWLSNGFGFGMETWLTIGPLFDGTIFTAAVDPQKARDTRDRILRFWHDLRAELPPSIGIETRGTNLGTATDLASDATPLRELYEGGFDFAPPPNSPWAAINGDFGIELAGYMSRLAELPPNRTGFPFRYYLHDPWWLNSPWLDRYEGQPHDIYLPLATARIASDGRIQTADTLNLLSIDDSHGHMPETVPNQSTPHLLRAWAERPDSPGPLVWLYPFDEIHDAMFGESPAPERLFHTDWFIREAINDGFPINTVISTRAFDALATAQHAQHSLAGRILVSPAPLDTASEQRLLNWIDHGGDLIVYGPLDTAPVLRTRLGLAAAAPLSGNMIVDTSPPPSLTAHHPPPPPPAHLRAQPHHVRRSPHRTRCPSAWDRRHPAGRRRAASPHPMLNTHRHRHHHPCTHRHAPPHPPEAASTGSAPPSRSKSPKTPTSPSPTPPAKPSPSSNSPDSLSRNSAGTSPSPSPQRPHNATPSSRSTAATTRGIFPDTHPTPPSV